MKTPLVYLIKLILLLVFCGMQAQSEDGTDLPQEIADAYLSKLTNLKQFNGVVLLKHKGEIILERAYNIQKDKNISLYVTTNSQFDLRSVAKLLAKASILQLEKDGLINKAATIETYLPDFPNGDQITIQHLLDHSSGLPREFSNDILEFVNMSPEQIVELAKKEALEFEPGSKSQYSNVGFQLVYYLIGKTSGTSFQNYLQQTFFTPLGMVHAGSHFDDTANNKHLYAYGHYLSENDSIICECSTPLDDMRLGNLYATTQDLDLFLSSLDDDQHQALIENGKITHAGGTRGKRAYVERDFKNDYEIIFLTNYDAIPFEKIVKDLRNIIMEKPVDMPRAVNRVPIEVAPEILSLYEGTYDLTEAGHLIFSIVLEGKELHFYQNGKDGGPIYPESEKVFFGDPNSEESITFVKDGDGFIYVLVDFQGVQWKGTRISD